MSSGDLKGFSEVALDELRHHSDRLLGMGLFWAWLQIIFTSPACTPSELFALPLSALHQTWALSLVCTVLVFLTVVLARRHLTTISYPSTRLTGHLLMSFGALFLVLASFGISLPVTSILGVIMTGVGSGLVFLLWGEHLALLETRRILFDMAVFSLLTALFFGLVTIAPDVVIQIAVVAIPLVSGLLFMRVVRKQPSTQERQLTQTAQAQAKTSRKSEQANSSNNSVFLSLGLAILVGLVYGVMRGISLSFTSSTLEEVTAATVVGVAIAGVFLMVTNIFFKKESELYFVCQISFPLLAAGFLLLPQFSDSIPLPTVVFTIGHSYFYYLLWVFCANQAQRPGRAPVTVFAIGLLAFLGSSLLGSIASDLIVLVGSESGQIITASSLIVVYIFVVAFAFVFRKSKKMSDSETLIQEEYSFEDCCAQVAKEGGLSPRESEIFCFLAQGKDRADISEHFVISPDTVKTHTRRIYLKLDIHSKKEARELVERCQERKQRGMLAPEEE